MTSDHCRSQMLPGAVQVFEVSRATARALAIWPGDETGRSRLPDIALAGDLAGRPNGVVPATAGRRAGISPSKSFQARRGGGPSMQPTSAVGAFLTFARPPALFRRAALMSQRSNGGRVRRDIHSHLRHLRTWVAVGLLTQDPKSPRSGASAQ